MNTLFYLMLMFSYVLSGIFFLVMGSLYTFNAVLYFSDGILQFLFYEIGAILFYILFCLNLTNFKVIKLWLMESYITDKKLSLFFNIYIYMLGGKVYLMLIILNVPINIPLDSIMDKALTKILSTDNLRVSIGDDKYKVVLTHIEKDEPEEA